MKIVIVLGIVAFFISFSIKFYNLFDDADEISQVIVFSI